MSIVEIKGLCYHYGPKEVLKGLDRQLAQGNASWRMADGSISSS